MTDTQTPLVISIANREDFRKYAKPFGITIGERGRMPVEKFIVAISAGLADGTIKIKNTPFFDLGKIIAGTNSSSSDVEISYKITYKVLNSKTGKAMPNELALTVTSNEIKSYLPHLNARGALSASTALMVVAIAKAKDGALLSDLQKYVIAKVEKVAVAAPETPVETDQTEDTTDASTDADKPSETDVHASEEVINAAMAAGELVSA